MITFLFSVGPNIFELISQTFLKIVILWIYGILHPFLGLLQWQSTLTVWYFKFPQKKRSLPFSCNPEEKAKIDLLYEALTNG